MSQSPRYGYGLRVLGDPILVMPARPVISFEDVPKDLIQALIKIMEHHHGLGMASQQVGGIERVCVARLGTQGSRGITLPGKIHALINPVIAARSAETMICTQERCLSVPGFRTSVRRHASITVVHRDERFNEFTKTLTGLDAQIVQHEIDHLNGICIADGVPRQQRRQAARMVDAFLAKGRRVQV